MKREILPRFGEIYSAEGFKNGVSQDINNEGRQHYQMVLARYLYNANIKEGQKGIEKVVNIFNEGVRYYRNLDIKFNLFLPVGYFYSLAIKDLKRYYEKEICN